MSIPGQMIFVLLADVIYNNGQLAVTVVFVATYLVVFLIQLSILLYIAHILVHQMWKMKIDPDNACIPYLTALGDLSGSLFLFAAFIFLESVGRPYTPSRKSST